MGELAMIHTFTAAFIFGLAIFALVTGVLKYHQRRRLMSEARLSMSDESPLKVLKIIWPVSVKFSQPIEKIFKKTYLARMKKNLIAMGTDEDVDEKRFVASCIILVAICFVLIGFSGAIIAYLYILVSMRAKISKRREEIELTMPNALDWLALTVETGIDFTEGLGRVAARLSNGALKEELLLLDTSLKMGTPRRIALTRLAERAQVSSLSSVVTLLVQADILGASIAPVLRASADRLRAERFSRAEKKGIAAAQKALLPLTFCIMPATFIVVFGPLAVRLATGGFSDLLWGG